MAAAVALASASAGAQVRECELPVMVSVTESDCTLSGANIEMLQNKITQAVTTEGFGGSELSHLCLTVSVSETDKQVTSGTRPVVSQGIEIYLVLTNLLGGEKFGSTSIAVRGAGHNEAQALRKAISGINTSNRDLQRFLARARDKVTAYYAGHIPSIIRQSQVLATRGEYEKALYTLGTVPPCTPGYDDVADAMMAVWQTYIDKDCADKLSKAMAVWHAAQTEEAAMTAAAYLAAIDHRSACAEDARALLAEISGKIGENIARVIAREDEDRAFDKEQKRAEIDLRRQEIDAMRQLALAYAQYVLGPVVDNLTEQPDINVIVPDYDEY